MQKIAIAVMLVLVGVGSLYYARFHMPARSAQVKALQKHFKPLCGEGTVKLPGWPKVNGEFGTELARIRKLKGAQRASEFASFAKDDVQHCAFLISTFKMFAMIVDRDRKQEVLLDMLFDEGLDNVESRAEIAKCGLPPAKMVSLVRAMTFRFEEKDLKGAGRGKDCQNEGVPPAEPPGGLAGAFQTASTEESEHSASDEGANVPPATTAPGKEATKVSGGLTSHEIMAVIRANLNLIRHCYESLLQVKANASGKLSVEFVIGKTGKVKKATPKAFTDTLSHPEFDMQGCVLGKIKKWAFPKPREGKDVTVNYPFVFNPL